MLTLIRLLLAYLVALAAPRAALAAEILALRHQLAVLERSRPARLPLKCWDRALWAFLLRYWSGWKDSMVLATTLIPPCSFDRHLMRSGRPQDGKTVGPTTRQGSGLVGSSCIGQIVPSVRTLRASAR